MALCCFQVIPSPEREVMDTACVDISGWCTFSILPVLLASSLADESIDFDGVYYGFKQLEHQVAFLNFTFLM